MDTAKQRLETLLIWKIKCSNTSVKKCNPYEYTEWTSSELPQEENHCNTEQTMLEIFSSLLVHQ